MKKIISALLLGVAVSISAQQTANKVHQGPPAGKAKTGDVYGSKISRSSAAKAITAEELHSRLQTTGKAENITVKGKVSEVCKAEGCWMTLETTSGDRFFIKNKDHAFLVPLALVGKNVVAVGDAELKTTSVVELKHFAEDAKKPQAEIDAITAPKQEIRFTARGVRVL